MKVRNGLARVICDLRADEVDALQEYANTLPPPYTGNRSAALRECLRLGMEVRGIAIDPLRDRRNP